MVNNEVKTGGTSFWPAQLTANVGEPNFCPPVSAINIGNDPIERGNGTSAAICLQYPT